LAAAVALLDLVDSAVALVAVVLQEPADRAPRVQVPLLVVAAHQLLGPEVLVPPLLHL